MLINYRFQYWVAALAFATLCLTQLNVGAQELTLHLKRQITHPIMLISLLCMVPLAALHTQAQTELTRQVTIVQDMAPIGLIFGQTLRYTRANLNDHDPEKRDLEPLRIQVKLLAADGNVIAQDEAAAVGAGKFQFFNFDRADLAAPGENETGRLQVRLEVTVLYRTKYPNLVLKQGMLDVFPDTVEIVNSGTGTTQVYRGGNDSIWLDLSFPSKRQLTSN